MNDNYIISIKGLQTYADGGEDSDIELLTQGKLSFENGVYYLEYAESEITGLGGTNTTIEIGGDYVSLERSGSVNSQMLFMQGRRTSSLYSTKYGDLLIDIYTEKLVAEVDMHGGKILIDYIIDVNNATSGRNNFELIIKEDAHNEQYCEADKGANCRNRKTGAEGIGAFGQR